MFGIQIACQQTFIALGNALTSVFLALLRKVILLIPLIFILPALLPDKVFGVFLAEPVADTIAVTVTGILFLREYKRLSHKKSWHGLTFSIIFFTKKDFRSRQMTFQSAGCRDWKCRTAAKALLENPEVGNESRFKYPAETGAHAPDS